MLLNDNTFKHFLRLTSPCKLAVTIETIMHHHNCINVNL